MAGRRESRLAYRKLRAPQRDGEVLIDPPVAESAALVEENVRRFAARQCRLGGRPLEELASEARGHLVHAARQYTQQYARPEQVDGERSTERLYLVGHQPELFHPGVWLKNFVLDRLARRDGATAVHVLIDNDDVARCEVQTPAGAVENPHVERVPFDRPGAPAPWEERRLLDPETFQSAGSRIAEAIAPLVEHPLIEQIWPTAGHAPAAGEALGGPLARMRHQLELDWGLRTLEVPLSLVCRGEAYHWFVADLLGKLPQLHERYNGALREYRRLHRLRTSSHPVPDLQRDGPAWEAPFWIWTRDDPRRRKLYAQWRAGSLVLTDREDLSFSLPRPSPADGGAAANALARLADEKVKIRPRALTTTLYLRMFCSDLFLHGIGGAKYDQITDCLIEDLYGAAPPRFLIVSGTRLLPIERGAGDGDALRQIDSALRDLEFHPENHIGNDLSAAARREAEGLAAEKRRLLSGDGASSNPRQRHEALRRINAALFAHVSNRRRRLEEERRQAEKSARAAELLASREFAFCLFPEATLRPWLLDASAAAS